MFPPTFKIEGPFAGVDPLIIMIAVGTTLAVIIMTAVVARQLARLQPKAPPPSQVQKASGEFDAWTERPKEQAQKDQEYYALYGSQPGRPAGAASPRAPPAPPPPVSAAALSNVVVDLSVGGPPADPTGWVAPPGASPPGVTSMSPSPPAVHPPARPRASGPTDEVVAPSHTRRIRDTSTGDFPAREPVAPPFERSSSTPGAVPGSGSPADAAYSPKAVPPPPPPPRPLDEAQAALVAEALPEGTAIKAPAKTAFRGPSRGQTVVGAGQTGLQEGTVLSPEKKAIRCPKCQTVFAGPAARPATVRCPACGTTGTLR